MHCLETNSLSHCYPNGALVLNSISLQVPEGSIYGFLGPNGAGKTTTLRLVLGLLRTQQGSISLFGKRLDRCRIEILRKVGALIESPSLYEHLTAFENLALLQKIYQVPVSRIDEVLALVDLANTGRKKVSQFSLGMKQRLSLAVALLHQPALMVLDEPTNGLDPHGIVEMRDLLIRINREFGTTILVSSHLLSEIEKLATHVGIIHKGRMRFQGTLDALRQAHQPPVSVTTNDDQAALRLLRPEFPEVVLHNGQLLLPPMPNSRIASVNRSLVAGGLDVHALGAKGDDLEAIFMEMVGAQA